MLNATRLQLKNHFSYIQQFMAAPRTVGTLMPSSPWLCQAMLNQVEWTRALSIAELGAADGVLTKRILARMRADAVLDAYEIQPGFVRQLRQIDERRLRVMAHSAEQLSQDYDVIFSCLPLLSMPVKVSMRILQQAQARLHARAGVLVLFQYSPLSEKLLSRYFYWKKLRVVRNFPPALVYVCTPIKGV
ncbi:phospholipid N-methyltransferase [Gibbsiella quercinecans]|uniref:Methyltransferase n=1 Tax=Gibbsiella quercinecans TaxID=929813 RepID=A0A250AZC2_9GAMM|nr:methyltransferase [Gibbsiella quercinecans]ATA19052.1 methyltransferase [Gibbsiella quercinecans]RLM03628.1 methyltransferase [Gibbsiella quercinecans]RLM07714.1 methyltransferase [Gibbsiella quercinecans]TCT82001.1 phospholipid N-methyltransferase [Gibbsiella quercinecans]